jgi:hypothetical protein
MRFSWIPLLAATLATVVLMGACAGQGEGEVCDPRAGNAGTADCRYPFVCTNASELSPGTNGDRCCPSDRSTSTGVCAISQAGIAANPAAPDGATGDAADGTIAEGATGDAADGTTADGATADGATADAADSAAPGSADSATADAADSAIADGPTADGDGALVDAANNTAADGGEAGD